MKVGRVLSAVCGLILVAAGTALTFWASLTSRSVNSVGVGGIFVVGIFLTLAGVLDLQPSSLAFGKDGVTLQLVAEAVKNVKATASEAAAKVATDPSVQQAVVGAKTETDAAKVAEDITQRIVNAMPATADLTGQALRSLKNVVGG
jgi:uncharacterized membrane protein